MYVNAWGRLAPREKPQPETLPTFYVTPPDHVVELLRVMCGACYAHMSTVFADDRGGLWMSTTDRLRDWVPGTDEQPGHPEGYWNSSETEPITDLDQWLYSGCRKAKHPQCGRAYSWRLSDQRRELAQAQATGRRVTIRL